MQHTSPGRKNGSRFLPRFCRLLRAAVHGIWLSCIVSALSAAEPQSQQGADFERDVAQLLIRRCVECHQGRHPSGNLVLTNGDGLLRGGDSGPVISTETASESLLLQRIRAGEMPPPKQGVNQKLPSEEIAVLQRWIEQGAAWPEGRQLDLYERTSDVRGGRDWWSLQPLKTSELSQEELELSAGHPIDAMIRRRLQAEDMVPAPQATPRERLRRLYQDLTGLPPEPAAIEKFEQDPSPEAWSGIVDELLDSPHFGERWARHWLDVARFAETSGYERDQTKPYAWKYRDWVVDAFNRDLPYDQFVRQQIAGDEIADRSEQSVIATGFLRLGTWNDEPNDPEDYTYERLEDLVHVTSAAFLALTVKCARCHDHKFDPLPQTDYYRMASVFWPGPIHARDRALLGGPTAEELGFSDVLGWTDITPSPTPLHVLRNGERAQPLAIAEAGPLSCLPGLSGFQRTSEDGDRRTTQRRLRLANWLTDPGNPLTPRVIVNRLWMHHFGAGLVRSANNFGFTGDLPTHPELLDWLARELIRGGWKLKPLHRLIVTSRTWQQSSLHPQQDEYSERDSQNALLWRAHRRRLDAESLRDAFLAATGELDLRMGGPSFKPSISEDALEGLSRKAAAWEPSPPEQQNRRSLYMFSQRSLMPPLMTTFDQCDTTLPCEQRDVTTVAPQALTLLNNEFVHGRAEHLADRVVQSAAQPNDRVRQIWLAILRREPAAEEVLLAVQHVDRQQQRFQTSLQTSPDRRSPEMLAWASLCLVLLNSNEFVYVD